jgi:hypothetical protein
MYLIISCGIGVIIGSVLRGIFTPDVPSVLAHTTYYLCYYVMGALIGSSVWAVYDYLTCQRRISR